MRASLVAPLRERELKPVSNPATESKLKSLPYGSVNWNCKSFLRKVAKIRRSLTGAWIETWRRNKLKTNLCRSLTGAWIETSANQFTSEDQSSLPYGSVNWNLLRLNDSLWFDCRSLTGAWIETEQISSSLEQLKSLPYGSVNWNSLSTRRRRRSSVAPLRERELKLSGGIRYVLKYRRSLTGAWIETVNQLLMIVILRSLPYGSVNWNWRSQSWRKCAWVAPLRERELKRKKQIAICHPVVSLPYGSVNWNNRTIKIRTNRISRSLTGAWIETCNRYLCT